MIRHRLARIERTFEEFSDDWEQDLIAAIRLLDAEKERTDPAFAVRDREGASLPSPSTPIRDRRCSEQRSTEGAKSNTKRR